MKTTITRYIGKCAICENDFKLTADKRMVHHGYLRPGNGSIHGDCIAVGHPPYEVSCEITKRYAEGLERQKASLEAWLDRVNRGEITKLDHTPNWPRNATTVTVNMGDEQWPMVIRDAMREAEADIRGTVREIARVVKLIAAWKKMPLRTVEEEEAAVKSAKDAAKAKRTADRDEKIAGKIAGYQKRLDTAVRTRSSSTIANIYEQAPRWLRQNGVAKNHADALRIIGRDHVFAAFGFDLAHEWDEGGNRDIASHMIYNFDKTFSWPASLSAQPTHQSAKVADAWDKMTQEEDENE